MVNGFRTEPRRVGAAIDPQHALASGVNRPKQLRSRQLVADSVEKLM